MIENCWRNRSSVSIRFQVNQKHDWELFMLQVEMPIDEALKTLSRLGLVMEKKTASSNGAGLMESPHILPNSKPVEVLQNRWNELLEDGSMSTTFLSSLYHNYRTKQYWLSFLCEYLLCIWWCTDPLKLVDYKNGDSVFGNRLETWSINCKLNTNHFIIKGLNNALRGEQWRTIINLHSVEQRMWTPEAMSSAIKRHMGHNRRR